MKANVRLPVEAAAGASRGGVEGAAEEHGRLDRRREQARARAGVAAEGDEVLGPLLDEAVLAGRDLDDGGRVDADEAGEEVLARRRGWPRGRRTGAGRGGHAASGGGGRPCGPREAAVGVGLVEEHEFGGAGDRRGPAR